MQFMYVFPHYPLLDTSVDLTDNLCPILGHLTYFLTISMSFPHDQGGDLIFIVTKVLPHNQTFDNMVCQIPTIAP